MTQRNWTFLLNVTQKKRSFFIGCDSKNFLLMIQRIELFEKYDSQNRNFFFSNTTQRIEPFFKYDSKNSTFFPYDSQIFFLNTTHRNEPFFSEYDQRIELFLFWYESKNWNLFLYDSKNWTHFVDMTQRIEPFFQIWLKEFNFFPVWLTDFFFEYDAQKWTLFLWIWPKNWTLSFLIRVKELKSFFIWLKELNSFCWYDSKNWTLFLMISSKNWFFLNTAQRIEHFFLLWT